MSPREGLDRKAARLKDYDYSAPGGYFITICTKERKQVFWRVGASCARPALSEAGKAVSEELLRLSNAYPTVRLDKVAIMPNHVHMILVIGPGEGGRAQLAPTVSRVVQQFKGAVTKRVGISLWQKGFYDHIIRNEADYLRIWEYIDANPAKWEEDCYYVP